MLVCEKRNIGFIHIPATGGTTLASYLLPLGFKYNSPSSKKVSTLQRHNKACEVTHVDCKKFAVVRNPYDREISMYHHTKKYYDFYLDTNNWRRFESDEGFKAILKEYFAAGGEIEQAPGEGYMHLIDVSSFDSWIKSKYVDNNLEGYHMVDRNDSQLSYITVEGEIVCDIIHYENLNNEYNNFAKQHGLVLDIFKQTKLNSNIRNETYWNDELLEIVRPYLEKDCEMLVYW